MSFWDWIVLLVFVLVLLYFYGTSKFNYFKNSDIKYEKPWPIFGNLGKPILLGESFIKITERLSKKFANERYIGFFEFHKPAIIINDPEIIKKIATKDFEHFVNHRNMVSEQVDPFFANNLFALKGQKWKDMRCTLSPAFTSSKMRLMFPFIKECSEQVVMYLEEHCKAEPSGQVDVEMKDMFSRYTNDVIATSAFGLRVDSLKDKDNQFYRMGQMVTDMSLWVFLKFILCISFPKLMKLLNMSLMRKEIADFFRNLVFTSMKDREEKGIKRPDMIHLLMEAKKGSLVHDKSALDEEDNSDTVKLQTTKRVWSDDDLAAQAFVFFIAGFETTSTLLSYAAYGLATNQGIQKKLLQEIQDLLQEGDLTYEKLMKMNYMDMFVSECLRIWPPVPNLDRECIKPYTLPPPNESSNKDFQLKTGDTVLIFSRDLHLNSKYHPNPTQFDPERFSAENKDSIQPFTYLPFGMGPRQCIGNRFALMEVKTVLFYMVLKFHFMPCHKTVDPLKAPMKMLKTIPTDGIWVGLESRTPKKED